MRALRISVGLVLGALLVLGPLQAQDPKPQDEQKLDLAADSANRMTVPVTVDGRGPYPFVVDTGAERTVISRELASELQLAAGSRAKLHSVTGASQVDTVRIPSLDLSSRRVTGIEAPLLLRQHMGAVGMLGVDSLQSQRVLLDFKAGTMTVGRAAVRQDRWDPDTIVVRAKSRYGRLVLVDASVDGQKVYVIIDTGSQLSVGNPVLQRSLARRGRLGATTPTEVISVTGDRAMAEVAKVRTLRLAGLDIRGLRVAFVDAHIFRQLRLDDRPAMLLGMDALRSFERVSVDFANRKVRFLIPGEAGRRIDIQIAGLDAARKPGS